jgi:hypothetical protein
LRLARTLSPFSEDAHALGEMGVLFLLRDMAFPSLRGPYVMAFLLSPVLRRWRARANTGCSCVPRQVAPRDERMFNGCA